MIGERLTQVGQEILGIGWLPETILDYRKAIGEQEQLSLREKSFIPLAVVADLAAPATSSIVRRVIDGTIDDGLKRTATFFVAGVISDILGYSALLAIYMQLPKDFEPALTAGIMTAGALALRTATISTINIIEAAKNEGT